MNMHKSDWALARQATRLFPVTVTADRAVVRTLRRKWIGAVKYLRDRKEGSHWALDKMQGRREAA